MGNQYRATCDELRDEIGRVRTHLAQGGRASEIANSLHAQGIGVMRLLIVFREATGASLGDLKAFGQWWGEHGVTDIDAFDAWAAHVFGQPASSA